MAADEARPPADDAEPLRHYEIGAPEGLAEARRRIARAAAEEAEEFDLGGLGLVDLPTDIPAMPHVRRLWLGHPKTVAEKPSYQLSDDDQKLCNAVRTLPAAFLQAFPHIEWLHLNSNQLSALPAEIGQLGKLQVLGLNTNQLSALPAEIGQLGKLQWLFLSTNRLSALPAEIGQLGNLQVLGLNTNQLSALPAEIGQLGNLQVLGLNTNQLSALPAEIGQLGKLHVLGLNSNQLSALPAEIGQLGNLQELDLSTNQLSALPAEIGQLGKLEALWLDNNQLSALPAEIGHLGKLEALWLDNNQLSALPAEIGQLGKLQTLGLNTNQLSALPAEIGQLGNLQELDLSTNQLSALPAEIGQLGKLQALSLEGNELPDSYGTAFANGGIEALGSLQRALLDGAQPLYEAKLLVTGEGKVGKSWALAALQGHDPLEAVGEDRTTYGVARGALALSHPDVKDAAIQLNAWDFGGQPVYQSTRQFFFSEDAVFLLVWNPRDGADKCQVRQWLRWIVLRTGGRAKVIMVATHSPVGQAAYRPDYGHDSLPSDLRDIVIDNIAIDSACKADGSEGDNVQALRDMIARHAAQLPRMGDPFPPAWELARNTAAALATTQPYIRYDDFIAICKGHEIHEPDQIFTLASVFMNRLGRAVYFGERRRVVPEEAASAVASHPEFEDAQLADILVLDAEWLTRAIVQLLEDEPTVAAGGMLDHAQLDVIWRTHGRHDWSVYERHEHPYLIRMMKAFDVSYVVKGSGGDRSLVAQLVPATQPPLPWIEPPDRDGFQTIRLACQLTHEVPGLMARLIVNTAPYHLQTNPDQRGPFWAEGVFLRESTYGNEALIRVEGTERPTVTITIHGRQPGWFIGELYRTLDSLLDFWRGLDKTYEVLCPTRLEGGTLCAGTFEFDFLVAEDKEHPNDTQTCQKCRKRRPASELLVGLSGVRDQRTTILEKVLEGFLAKGEASCPRAFIVEPVDRGWLSLGGVTSAVLGKELRLTLLSEHSLQPVEATSRKFTVKPEWVDGFGPVAQKIGTILSLTATVLGGDVGKQIAEAAGFMKDLKDLPMPAGRDLDEAEARLARGEVPAFVSDAEIEVLHDFLKELGIAPMFGGMKFVKIRNKGWLWATAEEAEAHAEETPHLAYMPDNQRQ